jgi:plastocyanin
MKKTLHIITFGALLMSAQVWAEDQQIGIKDHLFVPANVTVTAGTKVTWINHDADPHTVAEPSNKFRSSALDTNDNYSYTFTTPGTYKYFCTLHPTMVGSVTVK